MRKAIIVFLVKNRTVLLIQSFYPASKTRFWQGISGYVETNEEPLAAATREAKEELNIEINPHDLQPKHAFTVKDTEFHVYLTDAWQGEFKIGEAGLEELRWFSFNELPFDKMHPGDKDWLPGVLT